MTTFPQAAQERGPSSRTGRTDRPDISRAFRTHGTLTWDILEGRYLLCLLFEYVATLGMIDVAFTDPDGARTDFANLWGTDEMAWLSRYDGLQTFRLNPLGAYCLGLAAEYEPSTPPRRASLTVFPDRRLCADAQLSPQLSPDERLVTTACKPSG